MKIMIIGSMKFAKEMIKLQKELVEIGHNAQIPDGTESHLRDSNFVEDLDSNLAWCLENDIMRKNFKNVANAEAVLVVNHKRNEIDGFIGISALMEMGVAHYLDKKIFLLNDLPDHNKHRWAQEARMTRPVILNGNLKNIDRM
jgi:hypothetical protein